MEKNIIELATLKWIGQKTIDNLDKRRIKHHKNKRRPNYFYF